MLFDELGLTRRRPSRLFDRCSVAREDADGHPIVEDLLQYREVEKLRSTYGEGLLAEVGEKPYPCHIPADRGPNRRLSSDQPNLHNIPSAPSGSGFSTALLRRGTSSDCRLRPDRCDASPTTGGSGPDRGVRAGDDIHTATPRPSSTSLPVSMSSGRKRRWCHTASPTAWRPTGLRTSTSRCPRHRDPRELLRCVPGREQYMEDTVELARDRATEAFSGGAAVPNSSNNRQIRQAGERQAMNAGIETSPPTSSRSQSSASTRCSKTKGSRARSCSRSTTRSSSRPRRG